MILMTTAVVVGAFGFTTTTTTTTSFLKTLPQILISPSSKTSVFMSSGGGGTFYNDFEDFGDFEDKDENKDDDDDDEDEFKDLDVASYVSRLQNLMDDDDEIDSDDDDDDDDYDNNDGMSSVEDLISFATSSDGDDGTNKQKNAMEWADPLYYSPKQDSSKKADIKSILNSGVVLLANPKKFCDNLSDSNASSSNNINPKLLSKFGLTVPPPAELGPDRRADLLPVLLVLDHQWILGSQAVLLNRRTGYLIGDLEQNTIDSSSSMNNDDKDVYEGNTGGEQKPPQLWAFMIQPLWFGGVSSGNTGGLDMIHPIGTIKGCKTLEECEGLYWGGDPGEAQIIMDDGETYVDTKDGSIISSLEDDEEDEEDDDDYDIDESYGGEERNTRPLSGFDFKFFVQSTRWLPTQLEEEIKDGTWIVAKVSKEILFKCRDRLGSKRAKPLWTEIIELLGDDYKDVKDSLYDAN